MSDPATKGHGPVRPDHVRIYEDWHDYAKAGLVEALLELYAVDATLESPLIPAILDIPDGVCRGRQEIHRFLVEGTARRPNELVRWRRPGGLLWNGQTLSWEYPRELPGGEQIDIAEFMDITNGSIRRHRIYWGWLGIRQLTTSGGPKPAQ